MMISIFSMLVGVPAAKLQDHSPLPSMAEVRKALTENIEGSPNRRLKFVIVHQPGEPKEAFPALDSSNREEIETLVDARGRWREKRREFSEGALGSDFDIAFGGAKTTNLQAFSTEGNTRYSAHVMDGRGNLGRPGSYLWEYLPQYLGIRSSLSWAKGDTRLLLLNPRVDDQSEFRKTITLDPAKNYWPIASHFERQREEGVWKTHSRTQVVEFFRPAGRLFPKRLTMWTPDARASKLPYLETGYITVVEAEFPDQFDAAAFEIAIPDGASVRDQVAGRDYVKGEVRTASADVGSNDAKRPPPYDLWLIYFGFLVLATFVAGAARHLLISRRPNRPAGS
jgi:hypothetical protein